MCWRNSCSSIAGFSNPDYCTISNVYGHIYKGVHVQTVRSHIPEVRPPADATSTTVLGCTNKGEEVAGWGREKFC